MSHAALLCVEGLCINAGPQSLLRDISFQLGAGEVLTLLGESGAGKSLLAQAVMGSLPPGLHAAGFVTIEGHRTAANAGALRRQAWGRTLAKLPQEPTTALNPLMRIASQISEVHRFVLGADRPSAERAALAALSSVGLADSAQHYPWQLSGGMAQRAAMATACAGGAHIVIADEPTKGLDTAWRHHTVAMLQSVQRQGGGVIVITHDLSVARSLGGQIIVLQGGRPVEQGDAARVLAQPQTAFMRELIAAQPTHWPRRPASKSGNVVLRGERLSKSFGARTLFHDLDLQIRAGDRVVVKGPSGTGKSTLGNVLLGLVAPDGGHVQRAPHLATTALQKLYQDPVSSFAPHISLRRSLQDVAQRHGCTWPSVLQRLERLNISDELLERRPTAVSGGELQRVALARALTVRPALLFADEPTSRLDPLSQREAMALLLDAADETGAALLLVTHDDDIATAVATQTIRFSDEPLCGPTASDFKKIALA